MNKCWEREEKSIPMTEAGVIATMADLDGYAWPDPGCAAYYQPLTDATRCLPAGMGLPKDVLASLRGLAEDVGMSARFLDE